MWLLSKTWRPGYPAYHRHPGQVRIRVETWVRLREVEELYFVPPRSLRKVYDYVRRYGLLQTLWKVRSRWAESERNRKYLVAGAGRVVEPAEGSRLAAGEAVRFLAPGHPACVDEVCLDARLVRSRGPGGPAPSGESRVAHGAAEPPSAPWDQVAGWSEFSGSPLDPAAVDACCDAASRLLADGVSDDRLEVLRYEPEPGGPAPPRSARGTGASGGDRPTAVLFGLGHYAKNVILPRLGAHVDVVCLHELDPAQIGRVTNYDARIRTSGFPEADERYDVYLIAGFHHTHGPIAIRALAEGAVAVVEKPVVTTRRQLDEVLAAMAGSRGRLFTAFQRRYSVFNDLLREDLGGDAPIHAHALVYELPLPRRHWYRWPSSRGRVVSNGCHWIDHFLFLNRYATPLSTRAFELGNGDVVVAVDLENGASLSLTLTEHGSPRLGMRDFVQFRSGYRTATIVDQAEYRAENRERRIRKVKVSAGTPYDRMYRTIGERIARGDPGDSIESVRISMATMLAAEEQLGADAEDG